jgi:hypothetical protein
MNGRWRRPIGTLIGVALFLAVVAFRSWSPLSECERATVWAESLERDELPSALSQFSALSQLERRAVYARLRPDSRAALWREHLVRFGAAGAGLTEAQQAFVQEVARQVEVYTGNPLLARRALAEANIAERAHAILGAALSRRVLVELGAAADPFTAPAPATYPPCNCATTSDYCLWNVCARGGESDCIPSPSGCGLFLCHECDGRCVADD